MIHIFIVNPYAGNKTFADELRQELAKMENLRYFVFTTRYKGYEKEVVGWINEMFQGEELRFYVCGGSGTVRNMLCGFENLENVQIAIYPCGMTNDFLKVFGNQRKRFENIWELIHGDVIDVDYIQTNHGRALNTFSLGLDTVSQKVVEDMRILKVINSSLPYTMSIVYAIFKAKGSEYTIEVDGNHYDGPWNEVFFGNGGVLGGTCKFSRDPSVADGKGEMVLMRCRSPLEFLMHLMDITAGKHEKVASYTTQCQWKNLTIKRKDGKPFTRNFDGELVENVEEWTAHMVRKGLHLVVPKGVKAHE